MLFPGGFGSWRHWFRSIPGLAVRYEVHCVEPPGLGDSDSPLHSPADLDELADAVVSALEQMLGTGARPILVGFSFGGIVAGRVAVRMGARIKTLIISGSGALGLPSALLPPAVRITQDLAPHEREAGLRQNLAGFMLSAHAVDDLAVLLEDQSVARSRLNYAPILNSRALRTSLEHIVCPMGSLWAANDPFIIGYHGDYAALLDKLHPGCPFRIIEGASHWVMYERPKQYLTELFAVLDSF